MLFRKNPKRTIMDKLNAEMDKMENHWQIAQACEPLMKKLLEFYGDDIIRTVNVSTYDLSITLVDDMRPPEDFYTTCERIGLVIKDTKEHSTYSTDSRFYMRIDFDAYDTTGICRV